MTVDNLKIIDQIEFVLNSYAQNQSSKVTPNNGANFTIKSTTGGNTVELYTRNRNIDRFRTIVNEIVNKQDPDSLEIITYSNTAGSPKSNKEQSWYLYLRKGAEKPNHPPTAHLDEIFEKYKIALDEKANIQIQHTQALGAFEVQNQQKDYQNSLKFIQLETGWKIKELERELNDKDREIAKLEKEIAKLEKEYQSLEDQAEKFRAEVDEKLREAIEIKNRDKIMVKALSGFGSILGRGMKAYANENEKAAKFLNGLVEEVEAVAFEVEDSEGTTKIDKGSETTFEPEEENPRQLILDYIIDLPETTYIKVHRLIHAVSHSAELLDQLLTQIPD